MSAPNQPNRVNTMKEKENPVSNCCGAKMFNGMCEDCKEHCSPQEPEYILIKDCPNIGKEEGDYYNNEYSETIEELLEKGVIEEIISHLNNKLK